MYAFSSWQRRQSLRGLGICHPAFSQAGEAPVSQAPCTAGVASVKEGLTADDPNCRNDPGQTMNVWAVPKDLS